MEKTVIVGSPEVLEVSPDGSPILRRHSQVPNLDLTSATEEKKKERVSQANKLFAEMIENSQRELQPAQISPSSDPIDNKMKGVFSQMADLQRMFQERYKEVSEAEQILSQSQLAARHKEKSLSMLERTLTSLENALNEREQQIFARESILSQREAYLNHKEAAMQQREASLVNRETLLRHKEADMLERESLAPPKHLVELEKEESRKQKIKKLRLTERFSFRRSKSTFALHKKEIEHEMQDETNPRPKEVNKSTDSHFSQKAELLRSFELFNAKQKQASKKQGEHKENEDGQILTLSKSKSRDLEKN